MTFIGRVMALGLLVPPLPLAFSSAASIGAHHSWPATYDLDTTIQVEGELLRFQYRNPHSLVQILVEGPSGEAERWDGEWGGVYELLSRGVGRSTLRRGDSLVITGHPGRNPGDRKIRILVLERPSDGFFWGRRQGEVFN